MIEIRKAEDRGGGSHGWLDTRHTFSFADYHDPEHMGFRALRVINDDRVAPGGGFPSHPHRDMEIVTYVLDGAIEHQDSMGNGTVIRPGDVQRMSAGTGVVHSEFNHSRVDPLRLLQIWILPQRRGLTPGYEQRSFTADERQGRLRLIASQDGHDGSVTIHQDARIYATLLGPGATVSHALDRDRHAWVQVARGRVRLGEIELSEGDGVAMSDVGAVDLEGVYDAEVLLFDLS